MDEGIELWNDAAKSMEFQRSPEGSVECYERARELGDEGPEASFNRAVSYFQLYSFYKQDRYLGQAKEALLSAMEQQPKNSQLHRYLGMVYLALGDRDGAADEFFYSEEIRSEEESEIVMGFDLPLESPVVYESPKSDVYELLPDPTLHRIFEMVKGFPMDSALYENLRNTYGDKDSASLLALYLRSIYLKVFEDRNFSSRLGISTSQGKWEALLVFFVRGMSEDSINLVRSATRNGRLEEERLPAYTRLLVSRFGRELSAQGYDREGFRALLGPQLSKLGAIVEACKVASEAREPENAMGRIYAILGKVRLASRSGNSFVISNELGGQESDPMNIKLMARKYDWESVALLASLLRRAKYDYTLALAKRIRTLYDHDEATAHIKEMLAESGLSEEERFSILSEA